MAVEWTKTYLTDISLWLDIYNDDSSTSEPTKLLEKVPVSHVTTEFALGAVPTIQLILATGRNARNTNEVAAIHYQLSQLKNQFKFKVWAKFTGYEAEKKEWPKKPFLLFEGRSSGFSYFTSRQSISISLSGVHWLGDLDMGTVASEQIVRTNSTSFNVIYGIQTMSGISPATNLALSHAALINFNRGDFWRDYIKKLIEVLCKADNLNIDQNWAASVQFFNNYCKSTGGVDLGIFGNELAIKTLARFDVANKLYKIGNLFTDMQNERTEAFRTEVCSILAGRLSGTTVLDKIQGLQQLYMFKMVPVVETATMAQVLPFLSSKFLWRTLNPSDYSEIRSSTATPRPVRGVGIYSPQPFDTLHQSAVELHKIGDLMGAYVPKKKGMFLMLDAPSWLRVPAVGMPGTTELHKAINKHPDAQGNRADKEEVANLDAWARVRDTACDYAKSCWFDEVFRQKLASVTGRLRFDIAPGSVIRIKGPANDLLKLNWFQQKLVDSEVYGMVQSVITVIDSQEGRCSTSFNVSHLRSDSDDVDAPKFHPLYKKADNPEPWIGAPIQVLRDDDRKPERG